jgi:hypothetical protein
LTDEHFPAELVAKASLLGGEFGWLLDDFPAAIEMARAAEIACVGGQMQFRLPDAVCEMYWLDADSSPRGVDEAWSQYAVRSCDEVLEKFMALKNRMDFREEALQWTSIPELTASDVDPARYAFFVAYFRALPEIFIDLNAAMPGGYLLTNGSHSNLVAMGLDVEKAAGMPFRFVDPDEEDDHGIPGDLYFDGVVAKVERFGWLAVPDRNGVRWRAKK